MKTALYIVHGGVKSIGQLLDAWLNSDYRGAWQLDSHFFRNIGYPYWEETPHGTCTSAHFRTDGTLVGKLDHFPIVLNSIQFKMYRNRKWFGQFPVGRKKHSQWIIFLFTKIYIYHVPVLGMQCQWMNPISERGGYKPLKPCVAMFYRDITKIQAKKLKTDLMAKWVKWPNIFTFVKKKKC